MKLLLLKRTSIADQDDRNFPPSRYAKLVTLSTLSPYDFRQFRFLPPYSTDFSQPMGNVRALALLSPLAHGTSPPLLVGKQLHQHVA
jgi:hypothetical protein